MFVGRSRGRRIATRQMQRLIGAAGNWESANVYAVLKTQAKSGIRTREDTSYPWSIPWLVMSVEIGGRKKHEVCRIAV